MHIEISRPYIICKIDYKYYIKNYNILKFFKNLNAEISVFIMDFNQIKIIILPKGLSPKAYGQEAAFYALNKSNINLKKRNISYVGINL
jgi:hypothetical protein